MNTATGPPAAWSPLRHSLFRALWIPSVVSNLGTWMEEVREAWLMTDQTASPLLVSLLQTADSLPIYLLAIPAGALADIVDRRRLLLFTQVWMCAAVATLGVLTLLGLTTPWVLLTITCALGIGTALNVPAWQAITPEFQDLADPSRWVETFLVETWAEHLRQHERVTVEDRHVEDAVRAFQIGGEVPVVKHHIAGDFQQR